MANTFCDQPNKIREYPKEHFLLVLRIGDLSPKVKGVARAGGNRLESMIEEIEEYWEDEDQTPTHSAIQENERINTNEVFIIHGRDDGTKQQ